MLATDRTYKITWEILPEDFILDDEPADNVDQPPLAGALTESLQVAGRMPETALASTNYGICATLDGKTVVKAPDWVYIPHIRVAKRKVKRSYTPYTQGDLPVVVLEILSDTDGSEYSTESKYPPGKWFFYEQILQVPNYIIFEPDSGRLEVYLREQSGKYKFRVPDENNLYWLPEMQLFIGVWQGRLEDRDGYWLRWWDEVKNLLLWRSELLQLEQQAREAERQAREAAEQQALSERQAREAAEQQALNERQAREAAEQQALNERQVREAAEQQALSERQAKEEVLKRLEELEERLRSGQIAP